MPGHIKGFKVKDAASGPWRGVQGQASVYRMRLL